MLEADIDIGKPELYSPLTLAFIGDSVYEMLVRERLMAGGSRPAGELHKLAVRLVCASAQAEAYEKLLPLLDEREAAVLKRGRNANTTHVPKNSSPADYRRATGVEAFFGWLYLSKEYGRIEELFSAVMAGNDVFGGDAND